MDEKKLEPDAPRRSVAEIENTGVEGEADSADIPYSEVLPLEDLSPQTRDLLLHLVSYSGPLPAPPILREYKEIDDGALPWIYKAADEERQHRHKRDLKPLELARRGQTFAFILTVFIVTIGALLVYFDKDIVGIAIMLTALVGVLAVFIYRAVKKNGSGDEEPEDGEE